MGIRPSATLLLPVLLSSLAAQNPVPRPAFDVASVKVRGGGAQYLGFRSDPGGVHLEAPLRFLIRFAYQVNNFQIEGVSGWMDSEYYVVDGKTTGSPDRQAMRVMLQSLLQDRFALKVHRETKEGPIYSIVVARSGSKLRPAVEGSCVSATPGKPPEAGTTPCGYRPGLGTLDAKSVSVADLADFLTDVLDRPVIDRTELNGRFDFRLEYVIDPATAGLQAPAGPSSDDSRPTIFTALQEQLGLQLKSDKAPREYLVIDHAEKPSEN